MPFNRPSLQELDSQIGADIEGELSDTESSLRRSMLKAIRRALAGAVHLLFGYGGWIAKQIFVSSADEGNVAKHGAEWGVERIAAKKAAGALTLSGAPGGAVPKGTVWQGVSGQRYAGGAAVVLDNAGAGSVQVEAVEAGAAGNAAAGSALSLTTPIAGVQSGATAAAGLTGGANVETVEAWAARILYRKRNPPQAGAATDYKRWADAARTGDHRSWVAPLSQMRPTDAIVLGTVIVYYAPDDIPLQDTGHWNTAAVDFVAAIAAVNDYIQYRRPADAAAITVRAPATRPLVMTIQSVTPDTPAVRAAIEASIADLLLRETEPGGEILVSHIREAISSAEGETDHALTHLDGSALGNTVRVTAPQHTIFTPGAITWT